MTPIRTVLAACLLAAAGALAQDPYEPNDTLATAHDLGAANGRWLSAGGGPAAQEGADWYRLATASSDRRILVACRFAAGAGAMQVALCDSAGTPLATAAEPGGAQLLTLAIGGAGTYYLRVTGENAGNAYDLFWQATGGDDAYEPNDDRDHARDLRNHAGRWLSELAGPGIQADSDWYRVRADSGSRRVRVVCRFRHIEGDIDLYLYDLDGDWVGRSVSRADGEIIDCTVPRGGDYLLWVRFGNRGNVYDLWWDAIAGGDDNYAPNASRDTAFDLRAREGDWLSAVDGPAIAATEDWFRIAAPPGEEQLDATATCVPEEGDMDLQLLDAAGTVLAESRTSSASESVSVITPAGGGDYFLRVFSAQPYTRNRYDLRWSDRTPSPHVPTGLQASDGTSATAISLAWDAAAYAATYEVFRHTLNQLDNATLLATVTDPAYEDPAVVSGIVYYYWVRAVNAAGNSAFSSGDSGYRAVAAPSWVTATDGTYADRIQVKCASVQSTTSFKVYRATTSNFADAAQVGTMTTASRTYDDTQAGTTQMYYYWVRSVGAGGDGLVSTNAEPGYRGLAAPSTVSATDGTYTDKVRVTWGAVSGAAGYQVYRNTSTSSGSATLIGSASASPYDDTTGTAGRTYYYWIKTVSAVGPGPLSSARDSGYRRAASTGSTTGIDPVTGAPREAWDAGYEELGGGWRRLDWFGDYAPMGGEGWVWHNQHAFLLVSPDATPDSVWLYASDLGWLWTGRTLYPFAYRADDGAWLWYNGETDPRGFLNFSTGCWEFLESHAGP